MTLDPSSLPPEFSLIHSIRNQAETRPEVLLGIGDDAAVIDFGGRHCVAALDVITEGTHFTSDTPPHLIGRKALAVNLSDLAAMAAEPSSAFIGLVLPKRRDRAYCEELYRGLFELAKETGTTIAGGDTNSWDGPLVLSVTVLGMSTKKGAATRSGARPGDWLFVTGPLGGSLANGRHLTFTPRIREALALQDTVDLHALIDLSDGLASDLFHITTSSDVGAIVDGHAIPIHSDVDPSLSPHERLHHALSDGEDFELLFAVSPEDGKQLVASLPGDISLWKIGEVTEGTEVLLDFNGQRTPLQRTGWSHNFGTP